MVETRKVPESKLEATLKGDLPPDQRVLTRRQAEYPAETTQLALRQLEGRRLSELDELLRFRIDPTLLFFRKVCGSVVRKDSITGIVYGVPNAIVYVEDTDCSFLGFFPVEHPWWWLWPIYLPPGGACYRAHRCLRQLLRLHPALGHRSDPSLTSEAHLLPRHLPTEHS